MVVLTAVGEEEEEVRGEERLRETSYLDFEGWRQLSVLLRQLSEAEKRVLCVSVFLNVYAYSISEYTISHA